MPIDVTQTYAADPDRVLAVLTDEAFLREWARALEARVEEVSSHRDGAGTTTTVRLDAPTTGIPPVFARFVGRTVPVLDVRTWTPDGDGGHRGTLDVRSEIMGRTALVTGERRLLAAGGGTRATVTGDVRVDAPLVGRQAEAAVRELVTQVVLRHEHEVLLRHLGESG
ncbi:uncharacterized protein YndB with AHSA1/START domain [Geodermatophilus bullaregiensis]|uniref:DUF2505 domain-containing protein n=1 Tax=Geodermatophilus bullaregiensis TaxID=1564160 RepID=UPI00195CA9E7|nr:DUF2505 domain-containing protein [Geodermatophilus bullaregiensis]MBM7805126.1 uncharacterized protein YndB with AHSA1/START domain [Geodermatophilus bullaregiensis]